MNYFHSNLYSRVSRPILLCWINHIGIKEGGDQYVFFFAALSDKSILISIKSEVNNEHIGSFQGSNLSSLSFILILMMSTKVYWSMVMVVNFCFVNVQCQYLN